MTHCYRLGKLMNGQEVGYIRVSSVQQNTERQLADINLHKIFEEKISGKNTDRPALNACLNHLREGDTLHVHSIDRLARNLFDLQKLITDLTARGVSVKFHKENMVFSGETSPMQELMLQMLGSFAQFERALIKERQKEGIAAAKAKGTVKFGAPKKLSQEQIQMIQTRMSQGANKSELAKEFKISRPTLYKLSI